MMSPSSVVDSMRAQKQGDAGSSPVQGIKTLFFGRVSKTK